MKHLAWIEEMIKPYKISKWQSGKIGCRKEENTVMQGFKNPGCHVSLATIFYSGASYFWHKHVLLALVVVISWSSHKVFFYRATVANKPEPSHWGFIITFSHTTLGRTPLDKWLALRRDLYLTTHNTHSRQTSMPPARLKHPIPASERLQIHVLDCAALEPAIVV